MKNNVTSMIKFVRRCDGKVRDLVDGKLVNLLEVSRNGLNTKYRLSAVVGYEEDLKDYWLVTRAGLSEKKISKGFLVWVSLTEDLIRKKFSGVPTAIDYAGPGKVEATYEINTRLGPEEQVKPINLAPRIADLVLFYKQELRVEDYEVLSARWEDLPIDPQIPHKKLQGYRILEIDLKAKLTNQNQ